MTPPNAHLTDLDRKLQEMAVNNWPQFAALIGADAITAAKVCLLRQAGRSYGEISNRLSITDHQARYGCSKCEPGT